jgi:hypothetical protein
MSSNVTFKNVLKSTVIAGSVLFGSTFDAHSQADPCPPRYRARLEAVNPVAPAGWDERMRELPQASNLEPDAELVSISNDLSVIRNSPEFKRFQETYRVDPLNLDPKLEPKRLLANAVAFHGAYVGEAEKGCIAVGGFNKRILELQEESNKAFEDYKHDEWIDFASNSLSVAGNVILYATGVGEVAQAARAALKVRKLRKAVPAAEADLNQARHVKETSETFRARWEAGDIDGFAKRYSQIEPWRALDHYWWRHRLYGEARWALRMAESNLWGAPFGLAVTVTPATINSVATGILIGGDVWKQFQGFVNPYEEMINLNLEQKKKWVGTFQTNHSQALALKGKIEALMKKIVSMEQQPAPPGIGYGGFTVSREGES